MHQERRNFTMQELRKFIESRSIMNLLMVAVNIIVFFILDFSGNTLDAQYMAEHGAFYLPYVLEYGEYYRLFTCMFLHFGINHLFNNMLVLVFLGETLERAVGKVRYLIIYLIGGLGGGLFSFYHEYHTGKIAVSAGASGAVFAVIGALIFIVAINKGQLENISGSRLLLMAGLSLFQGFTSTGVDNWAHVGGIVSGFILAVLLYRRKQKREVGSFIEF